jgi:phospholipase/lecithinase/hemolysin
MLNGCRRAGAGYLEVLMRKHLLWAALASALLSACGGGGAGDQSPKIAIGSVKIMGDSLADSGTFGFKFTVQNSSDPKGFPIWPELVARTYGISGTCNFFSTTNGSSFTTNAGCVNYAVGGGRINNPASMGGAAAPYSIPLQMQTATAAGNFAANDLILVDGGGNDAADLVGAYLAAATDGGASYVALVSTLVPSGTVNATLAQPNGSALLGGIYMTALADKFYADISGKLLAKGAQRVAVLNMPAITNTPRFKAVLGAIAQAQGQAAADAAKNLFVQWIQAYNAELAAKFSGNANVLVVDFFTNFNNQVANPSQYGLTNVTTPACPVTGVDSSGLPSYTFPTCTSAALSASPPAGQTSPNWWQTYGFSDGFHPTPYGHQLLAQLLATALAQKGWL